MNETVEMINLSPFSVDRFGKEKFSLDCCLGEVRRMKRMKAELLAGE